MSHVGAQTFPRAHEHQHDMRPPSYYPPYTFLIGYEKSNNIIYTKKQYRAIHNVVLQPVNSMPFVRHWNASRRQKFASRCASPRSVSYKTFLSSTALRVCADSSAASVCVAHYAGEAAISSRGRYGQVKTDTLGALAPTTDCCKSGISGAPCGVNARLDVPVVAASRLRRRRCRRRSGESTAVRANLPAPGALLKHDPHDTVWQQRLEK
eukprot:7455029-Pyramimonas_sp.AAC.2